LPTRHAVQRHGAQTPWAGIVAQSPLVLVLTGAMWITYAGIYFLATSVFKRTPQDAAVLTLTVALPNYAALGLPISAACWAKAHRPRCRWRSLSPAVRY
jgi:predicted permease